MNSLCNVHMHTIDSSTFDNVELICDRNPEMALEMLANCNFDKSKDIILYLELKYSMRLHYADNRKHVNVRSLYSKIDEIKGKFKSIYHYRYDKVSIPYVMENYANNGCLTKFIFNKLMKDFIFFLNRSHEFDSCIKIHKIGVTDNIKTSIVNLRDE